MSPDGTRLAAGGADGETGLWDLTDPRKAPTVLAGPGDKVREVVFGPRGAWLATVSRDRTLGLWDTRHPGGSPRTSELADKGSPFAFAPDARWFAAGGREGNLLLWRLDGIQGEPTTLPGAGSPIRSLAFSPDASWIAAGDDEGAVLLRHLTEPGAPARRLRGHRSPVRSLALASNGRWVASAAQDGRLSLWRPSGEEVHPVKLGEQIMSARLTSDADERHLIAMGEGHTSLWRLDMDELLAVGCRVAGRNLSCDEWRQLRGQIPYRPTCPSSRHPRGVTTARGRASTESPGPLSMLQP